MADTAKTIRQTDTILLRSLGRKLREYIAASGHTQEEVADMIGIRRTVLLFYLKGDRAMPLDVFVNLAMALNVSPAELLTIDEDDATHLNEERITVANELRALYAKLSEAVHSPNHARLKAQAEKLERELEAYNTRLKFLVVGKVKSEA